MKIGNLLVVDCLTYMASYYENELNNKFFMNSCYMYKKNDCMNSKLVIHKFLLTPFICKKNLSLPF